MATTLQPDLLAAFDAARDAFTAAMRSAPPGSLRYRRAREDYTLGGLAVHVTQVLDHYCEVLDAMRGAGEDPIPAPTMPPPLPAVGAGLDAGALETELAAMGAAHERLATLASGAAPGAVPFVYAPGSEPWPTTAADVVGWVRGHYDEHVPHVLALAGEWATLDVVDRFNAAFGRHDVDAVMALMTEDVVFENTFPAPDGERFSGSEAVRAFWISFFESTPSARFSTEEALAAPGGRAVVRWRFDWDGGHVRGVDVFAVRDGRVAEKLSYVKG